MGPVYVAFDGDNDKWAYAFMKGWKTNDRVDFYFEDAHDLDEMTSRAQNEAYVKAKLKERMNNSAALVVIVGEKARNLYKFVRWEIELALELGVPIIVANLNNKTKLDTGLCPAILRDACAIHVPFWKSPLALDTMIVPSGTKAWDFNLTINSHVRPPRASHLADNQSAGALIGAYRLIAKRFHSPTVAV